MGDIELIGAQKIDEIDFALLRAVDDRCDVAPVTFGKSQISAPTRDAAKCRTLKPFQPPSAGPPAGPIMPVSAAIWRRA
jgi:hypothetical protein